MALANWNVEQIIGQLNSGTKWNVAPGGTITWGTPTSGADYDDYDGEAWGLGALNSTQKAIAAQTLSLWSDVANINFQYAGNTANAQIKFQNSSEMGGGYAWAYYPDSSIWGGSVWFATGYDLQSPRVGDDMSGGWAFTAYIHEIGHALGLNHMGDYDASEGDPTYASNASCVQDSMLYSIMSYFTPWETGQADWQASDGKYYVCQTPMMNDIAAIQAIYGKQTTRVTDTVYGFNASASLNSIYNFKTNKHPVLCIYDTGGTDTLDLSGFASDSSVNLTPGTFSSCDEMTSNISIARDVIIENARTGRGNDVLGGNDADNKLYGGAGADSLYGRAGNDLLDGGTGNDILDGGNGDDTYIVDSLGDSVNENGTGTDTVIASVAFTLGANLENLTLTGTAKSGTGNDLNNVLIGNGSANILHGGLGHDYLDGGTGADQLSGGAGDDIYVIDNARDRITETAGEGTDSVRSSVTVTALMIGENVETIRLTGTAAISATGNAGNNEITGNAAANTLNGGAGDDALYGGVGNDRLDGGTGADTLYGGSGNDVFVFDDAADMAVETFGQGTDTVEAWITAALAADVENITLKGTNAINATGNELANIIIGNAADNILNGALGKDTLSGGAGKDIFVFTALGADNVDTIKDFSVKDDTIWLDDSVFISLSTGNLTVDFFRIGTAALDANDRILYNAKTGTLWYDADGNDTAAAVQFAILAKNLALTAADFVII